MDEGKLKQNSNIAICRHEIATNLEQIIIKAGKLIKPNGRFYVAIPSNRLCECIILLSKQKFEVKQMDIYNSNGAATVCLLESVKCGKAGVVVKVKNE